MDPRHATSGSRAVGFEDPARVRAVLGDTRLALPWLVLRVSLGWFWLDAGWRQLQGAAATDTLVGSSAAQTLAVVRMLAGIALILGVFVGPSAFAGGLVDSTLPPATVGLPAPLLFTAVVALVLAWKTAGWIGLDRWLLPLVGMPWRGGALFGGNDLETERSVRRTDPRRR